MTRAMFRGLLKPVQLGTPHRYYRVRAARVQGGVGDFGLCTLEMRATPGGADQCVGGTAFADSVFDGTTPASKAFDGNDATLWNSLTGGVNHSVGYDFGLPRYVNQLRVVSRSDYALANATTLVVESSDISTSGPWTTEWSHSIMADWALGEARLLTRPSFNDLRTLWRLLFMQNFILNPFASFSELEIRSAVGGSNLATSSNIAADTTFDGTVPVSKLVDGNPSTFWTSGNGPTFPHWITFTAASPLVVLEYVMTARNDGTAYQLQPSLIYLQHCLDGKSWVDLKLSGFSTVSSGEVQTFLNAAPFAYR